MRFRNQLGVTLLQAMIMMAAVIMAAGALYQATTYSKQSIDEAKRTGDSAVLVDLSIERMRALLLDTGAQKKEGVCRLFSTPMKSGGTGNIYLKVPPTSQDPLQADWLKAFPAAQFDDVASLRGCTRSALKRCLVPKAVQGVNEIIYKKKPLITASLILVNMRNTTGRAIDPVPLSGTAETSVNARDAGLVLTAALEMEEDGIMKRTGSAYATIWTGEITCGFTTSDGAFIFLNPSAIGSGTNPGGTLFSSARIQTYDNDEVLSVNFVKYENTKWKVENGTNKSDYSSGIVSSICKETRYACPGNSGARTWDPASLSLEASVKYLPNSKISSDAIVARPEVIFVRASGNSPITGNAGYELSHAPLPDPRYATFVKSPVVINARFSNSDAICSQVCTAPSYNTGGDPYSPSMQMTARSDFSAAGTLGPYTDSASATYCSCCAIKQCTRPGYLGKMACAELPAEPKDSRLAECEATSPDKVYAASALDAVDSSGLNPGTCVTVRTSGGNLVYESAACGESHPALCFFQGEIAATRSLAGGTVSGSFADARMNCYKMGEEILNKSEVDKKLTAQGTTAMSAVLAPYASGGSYRFVNMATAGQFVAPETGAQMDSAARALSSLGSKAWIGLRVDSSSRLYAPAPELENSFMSSVGYYTEPTRRFVAHQDASTVPAGDSMLLVHSRKFFGPLASADTGPAGTAVLCRSLSSGRLFRAGTGTPTVSGAPGICAAEGGAFLPPVKPAEWHHALTLAAGNDPSYPWPNEDGVKNTVWVGLSKASGAWAIAGLAPAGTGKVDRWGKSAAGAITKKLCSKRGAGNKLTFRLKAPADPCDTNYDLFGAIVADAFMDNHDLIMFLAKSFADGDLNDASVVGLVSP